MSRVCRRRWMFVPKMKVPAMNSVGEVLVNSSCQTAPSLRVAFGASRHVVMRFPPGDATRNVRTAAGQAGEFAACRQPADERTSCLSLRCSSENGGIPRAVQEFHQEFRLSDDGMRCVEERAKEGSDDFPSSLPSGVSQSLAAREWRPRSYVPGPLIE